MEKPKAKKVYQKPELKKIYDLLKGRKEYRLRDAGAGCSGGCGSRCYCGGCS